MIKDRNIDPDAQIQASKISGLTSKPKKYYVDRNIGASGDGTTLAKAYLTLTEAVTQVNADYTNSANIAGGGRNRLILISEGWYAELPITLTASDVHILATASGYHDSTVLYGVPVAGTFSGTAGGPALTLRGSNCTIENLGVYTSDPLYAGIQNGTTGAGGTTYGNAFINVSFVRDVADGQLGGILDYGADGFLADGCFFSTSCKEFGIRHKTNGVINPVNPVVRNCRFVGTPIGVDNLNAHNLQLGPGNWFMDDTSDRADTCDYPLDGAVGSSTHCGGNFTTTTTSELTAGYGGTLTTGGNFGSDTDFQG